MIERAARATGRDLTEFVLAHACDADRRVLADWDRFDLDPDALAAWEAVNARRARDLPAERRCCPGPRPSRTDRRLPPAGISAGRPRPRCVRGQFSGQALWLCRYARQSAAVGTTRVFVGTDVRSLDAVAYYGSWMAQLVGGLPLRGRDERGPGDVIQCHFAENRRFVAMTPGIARLRSDWADSPPPAVKNPEVPSGKGALSCAASCS